MKKLAQLVLPAVLLAGCVTTQDYQGLMNSWVGATEVEVIRAIGVPMGSYDSGGSHFISYEEEQILVNMYGGGTYSCTTLFELRGGRVVDWSAEGNNCLSKAPPARTAL